MGVEIHLRLRVITDLWTYGYLEKECGVILHRGDLTTEIHDKVFYLAHGDGLGDPDPLFKNSATNIP